MEFGLNACSLTFGDGRYHEDVDERGAVTLTHQRDPVRVTAERRDVLLDPVQGGDKVEQSVVARSVAVLRAQETFEHTHTVVTAAPPLLHFA